VRAGARSKGIHLAQMSSNTSVESGNSLAAQSNDENAANREAEELAALRGEGEDKTQHFRALFGAGFDANVKFDPAVVLAAMSQLPDEFLPVIDRKKKTLPKYKIKKMTPKQVETVNNYWNALARPTVVRLPSGNDELVYLQKRLVEDAIKFATSKEVSQSVNITKNDKVHN